MLLRNMPKKFNGATKNKECLKTFGKMGIILDKTLLRNHGLNPLPLCNEAFEKPLPPQLVKYLNDPIKHLYRIRTVVGNEGQR